MEQHRVFAQAGRTVHRKRPSRGPFDVPTTMEGSTTHCVVYYETTLGKEGSTIAKAVMEKCEADFAKLAGFFGGIRLPKPLNVIVAALERSGDGSGGAYHHTCLAEDLYCDIKIHPTMDTDFTNFLVVAEAVEVFEAVQSAGWECGGGNGEGLSRVLATELYPKELGGYTTAAHWLDTSNRPDYVNQNNPTDRDPVTNGCAVLFLNYMHTQLNIGWDKIVQAGGSDLGQTYAHLGLGNDGFIKFRQLMDARFHIGKASGVMTDNPFPL